MDEDFVIALEDAKDSRGNSFYYLWATGSGVSTLTDAQRLRRLAHDFGFGCHLRMKTELSIQFYSLNTKLAC